MMSSNCGTAILWIVSSRKYLIFQYTVHPSNCAGMRIVKEVDSLWQMQFPLSLDIRCMNIRLTHLLLSFYISIRAFAAELIESLTIVHHLGDSY